MEVFNLIRLQNKTTIEKLVSEDKIANLNVIGRMNNEEHWEFFVDNIENPKGFIYKSNNWFIPFSLDDKIIEKMLKGLEGNKEYSFAGVLKKYYDMIKKEREIEWEEPCYLYYMDRESLNLRDKNHVVESLKLDDVETVNEFYTYKDEESLEYLKDCIINRPSSVIYDENGNPVSWALVREDGSMGVMYTIKEHRGKGLAVSISIDLAQKVLDKNWIPYVHIVTDNKASLALAESIGFKRYGEVMWFGVK